jgi:hypothetical protein
MSKQNQPARRRGWPIHRKVTIDSEGENDEFRGLEAHQIERILAIYNRRGPATLDRTRREAAERELNNGIQTWLGDGIPSSGSHVQNALDLVAIHLAREDQLDSFVKTTSRFLQFALFSHAFALKSADAPDVKVELAFYQIELGRYLLKNAIEPAAGKLASLGSGTTEVLRKLNEYLTWYTASTLDPILEYDPTVVPRVPLKVDPQSRRNLLGATQRRIHEKPTILGNNIDCLRSDLGMSFEAFAVYIGLDRSSILDSVNSGATPRHASLQIYVSVFQNLGCDVTVVDIQTRLVRIPNPTGTRLTAQ